MKNSFYLFFIIWSICGFHQELQSCIYHYETPIAKFLKPTELTENESGLDLVDCIYVINLDERIEKWERIKALLDERELRGNRFSAINGWRLPPETMDELHGNYSRRCTKGEVGCLLSHISVLKDACERGFDYIWVLEDDVEFLEDIRQIPLLMKSLSEYDPEWDILYTDVDYRAEKKGYIPSVSSDFRPDRDHLPLKYYTRKIPISNDLMMIGQRFGMRSYLLSRSGIKKVLEYFTHVYLWSAVDIDIHYIPDIREYVTRRDIVTNRRVRIYRDTGPKSSLNSK